MHEWILVLLTLPMGLGPPASGAMDTVLWARQLDTPAVSVESDPTPQTVRPTASAVFVDDVPHEWLAGVSAFHESTALPPALHYLASGPMNASSDTVHVRDDWFAEDKLRHYFLSLAVTGMTYGVARSTGPDGAPALALAGAGAAAAGLWQEFYDRSIGRPFSQKDLVWDGLGIVTGLILASQAR